MGTDEIQVFEYLKTCPNTYVSQTEIMRRVGGRKRMQQDPDWVRPVLRRMLSEEVIECDEFGQYRLRLRESNPPTPQPLTMDNYETWELVLSDNPDTIDSAPC